MVIRSKWVICVLHSLCGHFAAVNTHFLQMRTVCFRALIPDCFKSCNWQENTTKQIKLIRENKKTRVWKAFITTGLGCTQCSQFETSSLAAAPDGRLGGGTVQLHEGAACLEHASQWWCHRFTGEVSQLHELAWNVAIELDMIMCKWLWLCATSRGWDK